MRSCHYLLLVDIVAEGTTSAFLWRPSWLSSGKNHLRFPLISSSQCVPLEKPSSSEEQKYVAVLHYHDGFGEGSEVGPFLEKHHLDVNLQTIQIHFSPTYYS